MLVFLLSLVKLLFFGFEESILEQLLVLRLEKGLLGKMSKHHHV